MPVLRTEVFESPARTASRTWLGTDYVHPKNTAISQSPAVDVVFPMSKHLKRPIEIALGSNGAEVEEGNSFLRGSCSDGT
jgi:hypothetical protein